MKITKGAGAALLLVIALSGCGSGGGGNNGVASLGDNPSASASASAKPELDPAAFTACLREHGLDVPDVTDARGGGPIRLSVGGEGVDKASVDAAMEACRHLDPGGGTPPSPDPEMLEAARQMAQCMRDNGVPDFPDPDADGGTRIQGGAGLDPRSDAFQAAEKVCEKFAPKGPDGSGPERHVEDDNGGPGSST